MTLRFYDPSTGSFLTRDPIDQATRAAYSYGANDPVMNSDPSGLCSDSWLTRLWDEPCHHTREEKLQKRLDQFSKEMAKADGKLLEQLGYGGSVARAPEIAYEAAGVAEVCAEGQGDAPGVAACARKLITTLAVLTDLPGYGMIWEQLDELMSWVIDVFTTITEAMSGESAAGVMWLDGCPVTAR